MQDSSSDGAPVTAAGDGTRSAAEIEGWLVDYLAALLDVDRSEIGTTTAFERFGLDSAAAVAMTGDLARWLDVELRPTVAGRHNTIKTLSAHIASTLG